MPLRRSGGRPLADQIYVALARRIDEGMWQADERLPSERALAEELGVCRVTVARAVNRLVDEGVLRRRRGSGTYIAQRQDDRIPVTGSVALLIPFSRDPYSSHIATAASRVLAENGLHVLFHDTYADGRREAAQIARMRRFADGLLVFPADPTRNHELYRQILDDGFPLIFVDRYYPTLSSDWVVTDNFNASLEAVRRLLAQGCRRIVHITTSELYCTSTNDRRLGFSQALLEAGLPIRPRDIRIATPATDGDLYAPDVPGAPPLAIQPLIRALMEEPDPPDGLFAVNDWTTLACLHALHHAGIRVPEDMAVAGFVDNDLVAHHLPVPIVAVSQPKDAMGQRAAEILVSRLHGNTDPPQQDFLPATVLESGGAWSQPVISFG